MGDKVAARQLAIANGVPVVPGTEAEDPRPGRSRAHRRRDRLPGPAQSRGGRRRQRHARGAHAASELADAIRAATGEATAAFGYGGVYIEKYLEHVRHIEIQLLADSHGNCIHLGERECSIQRRHQKLIEESPSPVLDRRHARRAWARWPCAPRRPRATSTPGTIEFLFTPERQFYFLEMNTRLQVEHPVTELVTGLDLVQEQLRIAAGEPLRLHAGAISRFHGHAIECRITAEDPEHNFLPSIGRIAAVSEPQRAGRARGQRDLSAAARSRSTTTR